MGKLLFFALVALAVWWALRTLRGQENQNTAAQNDAKTPAGEDMVRCAECGVHLPRSEAVMRGGEFFCSAAHMQAHRK